MSGVGELAFYVSGIGREDLNRLSPIMAVCLERNAPVMIHTNEPVGHDYPGKTKNTLAQIYAMVKKYNGNRLILAHWGGGIFWYNLMKKEVSQTLAHVWFDTAASPYLYRPEVYRLAVELAGPEKILFGTDYPLLSAKRYLAEMDQAGVSAAHKEMICGSNAAALLRLAAIA
jgi:predicted TIM-barrel fold metal-dependent hydrolase